MRRFIAVVCLFFLAMINAGCATLADAQAAKGSGSFKIYSHPYDVVWNAAVETVKSSGLDLIVQNKEQGNILAQRGMTAFSYGEHVAVFVERTDDGTKTRVEVVNKRALATNITAANWETRILEALDKRLQPASAAKN